MHNNYNKRKLDLINIVCITNRNYVAHYSFAKKKIKILKSLKLKQQDVSSEILVTVIDVKCNFT